MSRNKLQILLLLFCINIIIGFSNALKDDGTIFDHLNNEERKNFFGTKDGSIPKFQIVAIPNRPRVETYGGDSLSIEFNYFGRNTTTTLNKVLDQQLISRNSTGFWFAESNTNAYHNVSYTPRPDIFDRIGNIEFFMNADDFSAVTRFWNSTTGEETYTGILKKNYTLKSVPREFKDGVINFIEQPLIQEITYTQKFVIFENLEDTEVTYQDSTSDFTPYFDGDSYSPPLNRTESENPGHLSVLSRREYENSGPIYTPEVVYPKVLLAPSYKLSKRSGNSEKLVQDLIAHLNVVDMIYRQFNDPEIRLHLSGIIIPQDQSATPYMLNEEEITAPALLNVSRYFDEEEYRFPFHTYDIVVPQLTEGTRHSFKNEKYLIRVGMAGVSSICSRPQMFTWGGVALAQHSLDYLGVQTLAHELAHAFNATHDEIAEHCIPGDFIMSPVVTAQRLVFSKCSHDHITYLFKTKRGSCTHGKPYEVPDDVKHLPSAWMSLTGQCENLFKDVNGPECIQFISSSKTN